MGFEEPHLRLMFLFVELGFARISHISAYATHQGSLVLWYGVGRQVIILRIGHWSVFVLFGWRFVFGIIMRWEGREPFSFRYHHDCGISKAVSLLLLSFAKVSNTKDMLRRQTWQETLCVSALLPHKSVVGRTRTWA